MQPCHHGAPSDHCARSLAQGDKTFFIAALLAARTSKLLTFAGCAGALALMTVISVAVGQIFHAVPASFTRGLPIDDYVAIASFLYFGVKVRRPCNRRWRWRRHRTCWRLPPYVVEAATIRGGGCSRV